MEAFTSNNQPKLEHSVLIVNCPLPECGEYIATASSPQSSSPSEFFLSIYLIIPQ